MLRITGTVKGQRFSQLPQPVQAEACCFKAL
jgi:hypothetical protein